MPRNNYDDLLAEYNDLTSGSKQKDKKKHSPKKCADDLPKKPKCGCDKINKKPCCKCAVCVIAGTCRTLCCNPCLGNGNAITVGGYTQDPSSVPLLTCGALNTVLTPLNLCAGVIPAPPAPGATPTPFPLAEANFFVRLPECCNEETSILWAPFSTLESIRNAPGFSAFFAAGPDVGSLTQVVNLHILGVTAHNPAQSRQIQNLGTTGFGQCGCDTIGGITFTFTVTFTSATTGFISLDGPNGPIFNNVAFNFNAVPGGGYTFGVYGLPQFVPVPAPAPGLPPAPILEPFDLADPTGVIAVGISSPTLLIDLIPYCTNKGCSQTFQLLNRSSLSL